MGQPSGWEIDRLRHNAKCEYKCNAGGAGRTTSGPKSFFPPLPHPPHPSPFPLNRPRGENRRTASFSRLFCWTVRGSGSGWRGCGGGGRNRLGPYAVSPASPASANFECFAFWISRIAAMILRFYLGTKRTTEGTEDTEISMNSVCLRGLVCPV